jgi:hypothetical protein
MMREGTRRAETTRRVRSQAAKRRRDPIARRFAFWAVHWPMRAAYPNHCVPFARPFLGGERNGSGATRLRGLLTREDQPHGLRAPRLA